MAIYKQVKTLPLIEAAYIAGLIDGEGTISLARRHRRDNRQLVVSISSTEPELLRCVQEMAGAGRITNKRALRDTHTPSKTYQISNRQALDLLKQITPYLRSYKADRVTMVLKNYLRLTPHNGHYSPQQQKERENFIQ